MTGESEHTTRKKRIDTKLDPAGWPVAGDGVVPLTGAYRKEEEVNTESGPAERPTLGARDPALPTPLD